MCAHIGRDLGSRGSPLRGSLQPLLYLVCLHCLCDGLCGAIQVPKLPLVSRGDYWAVGVYLYHCPIINGVYYFTTWNQNILLLFLLSLPPVALFAAFSWSFIEKPILKMRKKI